MDPWSLNEAQQAYHVDVALICLDVARGLHPRNFTSTWNIAKKVTEEVIIEV